MQYLAGFLLFAVSATTAAAQSLQFCALALAALKDQTASRIAARVADLELKTTAQANDGALIFSVCNEKTARQWKAVAGGTFQQQGDVPC